MSAIMVSDALHLDQLRQLAKAAQPQALLALPAIQESAPAPMMESAVMAAAALCTAQQAIASQAMYAITIQPAAAAAAANLKLPAQHTRSLLESALTGQGPAELQEAAHMQAMMTHPLVQSVRIYQIRQSCI